MQTTPTGADFENRLSELKEVKLKLPLRHHVSLHSLKLLRSQSISDLVADALDAYFAKGPIPAPTAGAGGPAAGPAPAAPRADVDV